jgi:hypothetical protein
MGWNWHNYEHEWQRRRKNTDEKRIWRDVRMTKDNEGTFHLDYQPKEWKQSDDGKYHALRESSYKLATITSGNVLTLLYEDRPSMTVCNRLTDIIGRNVWSDTTHHRNKENTVRIRTARHVRNQGVIADPWHPTGVPPGDWARGTIPYKAGLMFRLDTYGDPIQLLTSVEDISVLVKNEAVQRAKAETKVLRVLVRSMVRLGVFDDLANQRLSSYRSYISDDKLLEQIDYKTPTAESAKAVLIIGLSKVNVPNQSHYVDGTWTKRSLEDRRRELLDHAIDSGLKVLRNHIYSTTDGYERVVK